MRRMSTASRMMTPLFPGMMPSSMADAASSGMASFAPVQQMPATTPQASQVFCGDKAERMSRQPCRRSSFSLSIYYASEAQVTCARANAGRGSGSLRRSTRAKHGQLRRGQSPSAYSPPRRSTRAKHGELRRGEGSGWFWRLRCWASGEELGDHLDERVALGRGITDESSRAQTLTLEVGDNVTDGSGVLADDHHANVAQDPGSGPAKRPY